MKTGHVGKEEGKTKNNGFYLFILEKIGKRSEENSL